VALRNTSENAGPTTLQRQEERSSSLPTPYLYDGQPVGSTPRLPERDPFFYPPVFIALNDGTKTPRPFYPATKVHSRDGGEISTLSQSAIPYTSPQYRLRSDGLAHTLHLFAQKVEQILPEGYSVQIDISPLPGHVSKDSVHLIRHSSTDEGRCILERAYHPFNGESIGGIIPSDQARNTVLKIEERLFYYTTFLAIKKAIETERSLGNQPGSKS